MKRLSLTLAVLIGLLMMAGCQKDPETTVTDPTLTLKTGENYLYEGAEIMVGTPIKVGFDCKAEKLNKLTITFKAGETILNESEKTWENSSTAFYEETFTLTETGDITMTATLTDNNDKTATLNVNFKSIETVEPTLTLVTDEGFLANGDEIVVGDPIRIGLTCDGYRLNSVNVAFMIEDAIIFEDNKSYENVNHVDFDETYTLNQIGDCTMTATLTDAQGQTATVTVDFTCVSSIQPDDQIHYQGVVTMSGTASALVINLPIETVLQMEIAIAETEEEGTILANVTIDEQTYQTTGTKQGDNITFETFDINLVVEGSSLNATLTMNGVINGAIMTVGGDIVGSGNMSIPNFPGQFPVSLNATIAGDLDLVE